MLTLEHATYRYAGASAPSLHDLDLRLADGEVVGLVGASESGKSTVCLVASGLAPRTIRGTLNGRLLIDGQDVTGQPMHVLSALVGIGFQSPGSQLSGVCGSVFEEVAFGPMNLGQPLPDVIARTNEAMRSLGIEALAERDPARLSGGQMQLVALAGLLAMRPRHLILDEPTAELDPAGTALVGTAVAGLASRGSSILIAEHKTDLLARICDRVVVLDQGRIALQGPAGDVLADERLVELGVSPPAAVRLRRAVSAAGLDPALLGEMEAA